MADEIDLSLASLFAGWALADEVQRRLAADGLVDLRFADGVVFQHLVTGPLTVGVLAERLGPRRVEAALSHFSSRDSRRSFSTLPAVWSCGQ